MGDTSSWPDIVTAACAIGALGAVTWQIHYASKLSSLQTVEQFISRSGYLWRDCIRASSLGEENDPGRVEFKFATSQVLAHLKLSSIYLMELPTKSKTYCLIEETLIDTIDAMSQSNYSWVVCPMIEKKSNCSNIKDFCKQRINAFSNEKAVAELMCI